MSLAKSIASSVVSSLASSVAGVGGGGSAAPTPWQLLLDDVDLVSRLNGDANADGTGDANDYTGNFNGTWSGTPAYLDPPAATDGKSFSFDGASAIQLADAAGDATDNFTFTAWVKRTSATNLIRVASKRLGVVGSEGWEIYADGNSRLVFFSSATAAFPSAIGSLSLNTLTHVSLVVNGTSSRWYINGVASGTAGAAGGFNGNNSPLYLGRYAAGASGYWGGTLADIRMYSRVLTPEEISTIITGP